MDNKFPQSIIKIISYSREEAIRLGNNFIGNEHLFLGVLREGNSLILKAIENLGFDLKVLKRSIEGRIRTPEVVSEEESENLPLKKPVERSLKLLFLEAKALKAKVANPNHLVLAIVKEGSCELSSIFRDKNIDYSELKETFMNLPVSRTGNLEDDEEDYDEDYDEDKIIEKKKDKSKKNKGSETPVLDNFGIDLTKAAERNLLDPIVGRDLEIERLVQILSRRKKNNPVLIGEPGVGKSAIAEGLAIRIIQNKVSRVLYNKRIVTLDIASVVAGTKYRGQFEERMKAIINELTNTNNVILFIDEIHTIIGAGGAGGSLDASNMLKPALARGELQCIGATTLDEYRQHIEKDGALERRFQKIMVDPTTAEETIQILHNIKERYENHHNVTYTDEALEACVSLTNRYVSDRHLPDKAIDALDEAGARVHVSRINVPKEIEEIEENLKEINIKKNDAAQNAKYELAAKLRDEERNMKSTLEEIKKSWVDKLSINREKVAEHDIAEVVAMMTGVPVQRIAQAEGMRLLKMKQELQGKVIGQDDAIEKLVKAIKRNRAGLKDPNKPIGTFIFLGPTGVGKTHLAKVLAEFLFDSKDALIRIDMSEYMEKFAVSRLVGAPPGYIGYEEGGQLTEKVRRKPYSVVLLDEIEKAHPDVFHLLLQVLDEGLITDSSGRKINFKNCIVIMTSNIGARQVSDFGSGVGFATPGKEDVENTKNIIKKALKRTFSPEFLNRIDDVILFDNIEREGIHKIIDIELSSLYKRVEELGYKLTLSTEVKDFVAEKGYDSKFGARPLKRAIQKYLEDEMSEVIIEAQLIEGDEIIVNLNEAADGVSIKIIKTERQITENSEIETIQE